MGIDNIRNLSQTVPGESDLFQANAKYCAVPLSGPGGCIGIYKVILQIFVFSIVLAIN
jgi:hypothetical protein